MLLVAVVVTASGGAPSTGVGSSDDFEEQNRIETERMERDALKPEDEAKITAAEDDIDPPPTVDPGYTVVNEPVVTIELPIQTFEQAISAADYVFTATIVGVSDPLWNTSTGEYGSHADWEDTSVDPFQWQQIDVVVTEDVRGNLEGGRGDGLRLACAIVAQDYCGFGSTAIGASLLVGGNRWTIEYRDGTTIEVYDIHPQATYISFPGGPALRLLDVNSGNWHIFGGASADMPDETTVDVVRSLDELVARALNPNVPLEQQLGYDELYGTRDTNPDAAEIVP